jgi:hypothetical protein
MGTRGLVRIVVKNKVYLFFCKFDSYFSGGGAEIVQWLQQKFNSGQTPTQLWQHVTTCQVIDYSDETVEIKLETDYFPTFETVLTGLDKGIILHSPENSQYLQDGCETHYVYTLDFDTQCLEMSRTSQVDSRRCFSFHCLPDPSTLETLFLYQEYKDE